MRRGTSMRLLDAIHTRSVIHETAGFNSCHMAIHSLQYSINIHTSLKE